MNAASLVVRIIHVKVSHFLLRTLFVYRAYVRLLKMGFVKKRTFVCVILRVNKKTYSNVSNKNRKTKLFRGYTTAHATPNTLHPCLNSFALKRGPVSIESSMMYGIMSHKSYSTIYISCCSFILS